MNIATYFHTFQSEGYVKQGNEKIIASHTRYRRPKFNPFPVIMHTVADRMAS